MRSERRVVIVGAGIGGLAAAVALSARGFQATVLEAAEQPGGKMREVEAAGLRDRRRADRAHDALGVRWDVR